MELITIELKQTIPKLYEQEDMGEQAMVYCKFFDPCSQWTWYVLEFDGEDIFFGYVIGHVAEYGYFSLKELQSYKGRYGLGIERDLWFQKQTIKQIREEINKWR